MSDTDTLAEPLTRKFVPVSSNSVSHHSKFSVVSYNILAQAYVKNSLSISTPSYCQWKNRSHAVLSDLKNLDADFLCLQEVDEYDNFYKRNLEDLGYSSIYVQRNGGKPDGCGIFYKTNTAKMLMAEKIDYNDLLKLKSDKNLSSKDVRRLKRDCVGIMAAFKLKKSNPLSIILANTHIYWDPNLKDVKLAQAKYLVSRLSQFQKKVSYKLNCTSPIIVCGDFNSRPGDQVYQYLQSCKTLQLRSLYGSLRGEPEFTNYKRDFTATLDYIFLSQSLSPKKIKPFSCLELPKPESFDVIGGLPNNYHPSDHLPIGAEFELLS